MTTTIQLIRKEKPIPGRKPPSRPPAQGGIKAPGSGGVPAGGMICPGTGGH